LSTWETFLFGALGGGIAYVVGFVLPQLRRWYEDGIGWESRPRLVVAMAILVVYLLMAGVFAAIIIGGATEPKHAIVYGIAWEAGLKGLVSGAETLKGKGHPQRP
jgi:hypothetical protein